MRIALASDHAGFALKEKIKVVLTELGHQFKDFGTDSEESCDYPDFAFPAAESVARGNCDAAILVCGSGIGMSMCANKVAGVRAALCCSTQAAELCRLHNNANALCIGARLTDTKTALNIVRTFLVTSFEGGRHLRRVNKISQYEKAHLE
ncbi:MAG: ribose 5-phosphate isomerase B [Planctomycetota bacterium]|nr:MAG: ribose 5-phosphate isomerase B [Planctomycetota bacterium]